MTTALKTTHNQHNTCTKNPLHKLRSFVLLAGFVRPTQLSTAIGRSLLDLPMNQHQSLLDQWLDQASGLAKTLEIDQLQMRVEIDQTSPIPRTPKNDSHVTVNTKRDSMSLRGTGGVLRDLAMQYNADDYLLIANGAQVLLEPLSDLTIKLANHESDVALISDAQGTPSGLMLIRCGVLEKIPAVGFVDLKEQVLPGIVVNHKVKVLQSLKPCAIPIRTNSDYINAIRASDRSRPESHNAFAENWQSTFRIVESGANVAASNHIHDSVVLKGATVMENVLLVRSTVCSGAVVKSNSTIVDKLVLPNDS